MKRVETIDGTKYVLENQYKGFGIYQEVAPNGMKVYQSYMFTNGSTTIVCDTYNNLIMEEILDMIDNYEKLGMFDIKVINKGYYVMHPSGKERI